MRNDPFLETIARREWTKMCRSLSLGAASAGMPNLWLEIRPTRAFAAQPRTDQTALTLTLGVEAETRIVPAETKPNCPFPAQLDIVPQLEQGRVNLAVPIDVPFTELNRLLEAQLKGKTFPEDKSGAFAVNVRGVSVTPLRRPPADRAARQGERAAGAGSGSAPRRPCTCGAGRCSTARGRSCGSPTSRSTSNSEAAFGILGAAARATAPYLEAALAENAVVDLNPLVQNARKSIEAAIADFSRTADGVRVDAAVTALRLVGIEFDAKTLRVVAEADGTVKVAVTALPLQ